MDKKHNDFVLDLSAKLIAGNRLALAQVITLLESEKSDDQKLADFLIKSLPKMGSKKTLRLGISGVPGVGKSTLIEQLGLFLIAKNLKVAVLAIDPSSEITQGSVLGDKTRMEELSRHDNAFIRPSASRGHLGGVTVATHDTIQACEAAGYDVVIVETVGVGQSESHVANLVDYFVFMALPNAGDELQGIKKGILERIDALIINKYDGENKIAAQVAEKQFKSALKILRQIELPIFLMSAFYNHGVAEFGEALLKFWSTSEASLLYQRRQQEAEWVLRYVEQFVRLEMNKKIETTSDLEDLKKRVTSGELLPREAARDLMKRLITFV
jgi:LAO/AO transport system kinase